MICNQKWCLISRYAGFSRRHPDPGPMPTDDPVEKAVWFPQTSMWGAGLGTSAGTVAAKEEHGRTCGEMIGT